METDLAQPPLLAPGCKLTFFFYNTFSLLSQLIGKENGLELLRAVDLHLQSGLGLCGMVTIVSVNSTQPGVTP